MAATLLKVERAAAVALFVEIGFKTADKWDNAKLTASLKDFGQFGAEEANLNEANAALRKEIMDHLGWDGSKYTEKDAEIDVAGAVGAPAAKPPKKEKKEKPEAEATEGATEAAGTDKAAAKAEAAAAKAAEKDAKAKAKADAKAAKDAEKEAKKAERDANKASREQPKEKKATAQTVVGAIVARLGLAEGVTEAMVAEFGTTYGRENPYRTWFDFKAGWHAIRGYLADPIESAPGVHVSNTRPFLAGRILLEKGLDAEINAALAAELDARYGKVNEKESIATLRLAKGAIEGYNAAKANSLPE